MLVEQLYGVFSSGMNYFPPNLIYVKLRFQRTRDVDRIIFAPASSFEKKRPPPPWNHSISDDITRQSASSVGMPRENTGTR